jgi:MOSC domain-containing protein YiiM
MRYFFFLSILYGVFQATTWTPVASLVITPPIVRLPQSKIHFRTVSLHSWQDRLNDLFTFNDDQKDKIQQEPPHKKNATGSVVRLAARQFDQNSSKPSSREYTTRKVECSSLRVTKKGVEGDYNHYRTVALKSTEDRAVSILTMDVMKSLRATYQNYKPIQEGDLGENILVDGVPFGFFRVGDRYRFVSSSDVKEEEDAVVLVEITEPIEPCANLCKLPYINDSTMQPRERIRRCQEFIQHLDRFDGYRGWYAKVLDGGLIDTGAIVSLVEKDIL